MLIRERCLKASEDKLRYSNHIYGYTLAGGLANPR